MALTKDKKFLVPSFCGYRSTTILECQRTLLLREARKTRLLFKTQ